VPIAKNKTRRRVHLTKDLAQVIEAEVNGGRFGSFSDAVQHAVWNFFGPLKKNGLVDVQRRNKVLRELDDAKGW
jgi:Arc/MetJ-type ribon-helix-helix transcriptional regulator